MSNARNIATEAASSDAKRRCPRCAASISSSARFCFECGTKLEPLTPSSDQTSTASGSATSTTARRSNSQALKREIFAVLQSPIAALQERHQVSQTPRELYFQLGIALANQQDYTRSAEAMEQALKEKTDSIPLSNDIYFYLAYVYELAHKNERAFRYYLEAVLRLPEYLDAILLHVHSLLSPDVALTHSKWITSDWVSAIERLDLSALNRMHIKILIGRIYLYLADYQRALDFFKEAMTLDPTMAPTMIDTILAPEMLPPALAGSEKDGNTCFILAQLSYTFKNLQQALDEVNQALNLGLVSKSSYPNAPALELKGHILQELGVQQEAAMSFYEAGRNFYWNREYESAGRQFSTSAELSPDYTPTYWYWADTMIMASFIQEFPYVEKKYVLDSLKIWNSAFAKKPLDDSYSWVYITRALINEQLARLPGASRWTQCWEAIIYLERGMLLGQQDTFWIHLSRIHRALNNMANALSTTQVALQIEPENTVCMEERAAILANVGDFEEAARVVEAHLRQEENDFAKAIKAYILLHTGHPDEALVILHDVLDKDPDYIWARELQAYCYRRLGDIPKADDASRLIWEHYCSIAAKHQEAYMDSHKDGAAWAAYQLNKIDDALPLFESLRDDLTMDPGNMDSNIGLCYLAQGDLTRGEENLRIGIEQMINIPQFDDISIDLEELRKRASNWSHIDHAQLDNVLSRLAEKIQQQKRKVNHTRSPTKELRAIIKQYPRKSEMGHCAWIGANAGLARIYGEEKRWTEAIKIYQSLLKEHTLFPEASLGLQKMLDNLLKEGDICLKEGQLEQASEHFSQVLSFTLKVFRGNTLRQADVHSRLGFVYLNLADTAAALTHFIQAIQFYQQNNVPNPGDLLADVCRSFVKDAAHYWTLAEQWDVLLDKPQIDKHLHDDLTTARKSWKSSLDNLFQLTEEPTSITTTALPLPIALEIGEDLIPEDTSLEWALFKSYIPQMRQHIQDEMGMEIPGVRIRRSSTYLPSGGYNILLFENPVLFKQEVPLDRRYSPVSPEKLHELGIPMSDLIQAPHPITGQPGSWVAPDKYELVTSHKLELWVEPLVYIIYHLEAILRHNLTEFWNAQELEKWLRVEGEDENYQTLIAEALPDQKTRFFLTCILRALLREHVPITRKKDILKFLLEAGLIKMSLSEAIRTIRLFLKCCLPGNQPITQRLELSSAGENSLATGLEHVDGQIYFTAPPREAIKLLSMIRQTIPTPQENVALIIREAELRPFLRLLVEAEFPSLAVLSEDEVVTSAEAFAAHNEHATKNKGVNKDAE